mgnify:CR=1 FL=1
MAAAVAGFGVMAGGAMAADDKGGGHEEYLNAAPNCSVNQDWSYFRKCGDTEREPKAERTSANGSRRPTTSRSGAVDARRN